MNGKLISTIIVLLMVLCSFSAVGITRADDESPCECGDATIQLGLSLGDGNENPTELGLEPGGPDADDYLGPELSGEAYDSFDWRDAFLDFGGYGVPGYGEGEDWTTGVRDQGYCGSCYAFGAIASLEAAIKIKSGENKDLSEQYIVSKCGQGSSDGIFGCHGAYFTSPLSFIERKGVTSESCFGYEGVDSGGCNASDDCNNDPVTCNDDCTSVVDVEDWISVRNGREQIKIALIQHGPLVTAMCVPGTRANNYSGFRNYPNGINTDENYVFQHSASSTNHMVCIVGYCKTENTPYEGYWICKNSWGADWGITKDGQPNNGNNGGWFRMAYGSCNMESENAYFILEGVQLSADIPKKGEVGEGIHFSAEATGGNYPYTYSWKIRDSVGNQIGVFSGQDLDYSFNEADIYSITARVTDDEGDKESIEKQIRIYKNPPTIDIRIKEIERKDKIEGNILQGGPDWYYKIYVKGHSAAEWDDKITSDVISNEDENEQLIFLVSTKFVAQAGSLIKLPVSPP